VTKENNSMTEPRTITLGDIDANGNVVIWDHGPPADAPARAEWRSSNGDSDLPASILMHATTAAEAMQNDPARYALEPRGVSEAEVDAVVATIQKEREAAKKRAADAAAAAQLRIDLAQAHRNVAARRRAAAMAKPKAAPAEPQAATPAPGLVLFPDAAPKP
jgi:hypothetical protein